jgi:NAD(P)-dependent dehydrogenase (short-subunit alcohol dehydrogenase family)
MPKIWLVTGSSRGFGRSIAEAALQRSDRVVATARKPEQLNDLTESYGQNVLTLALDVTDSSTAKGAVDAATDAFGSLDIVVNNAGYADSAPIEEMSERSFRDQIETNLFGVVNVTRAALPVFHQRCGDQVGGVGD